MSLITWKAEYSDGNAGIDQEHRELIDTINGLHEDLLQAASADSVVESLGEIYANVAAHFALEERLMRDAGYEEYGSHKEDHEVLLDQITEIIDLLEMKGVYDEKALSSTLDSWFSEHFRTHDALLHGRLG